MSIIAIHNIVIQRIKIVIIKIRCSCKNDDEEIGNEYLERVGIIRKQFDGSSSSFDNG
jgi:hypothetical protein